MPSPPLQRAGGKPDHVHQFLGELGFLQHHAHEHEQRNGEQRVVRHHAEDAVRQQIEQVDAEAEIAEDEAGGGERQPDRNAGEQQHEKGDQHQGREDLKAHRRAAFQAMAA